MKCTHVALQVRNIEVSIQFYERFCDLTVVHKRQEDEMQVVRMGWGEDPPRFVIVLFAEPYEQNIQPPGQHIGMVVEVRKTVDEIFERVEADRLSGLWPPAPTGKEAAPDQVIRSGRRALNG